MLISDTHSEGDWEKLPAKVRDWFEDALESDDPKPSDQACTDFARELQIIFNRHDNQEWWRRASSEPNDLPDLDGRLELHEALPPELKEHLSRRPRDPDLPRKADGTSMLRDCQPADIVARKVQKVIEAASRIQLAIRDFEAAANDLEELYGGHVWTDRWGSISLEEVKEHVDDLHRFLWRIGAGAELAVAAPPSRGRRGAEWHATGRDVARLIIRTLCGMKFPKRKALSSKNEDSVTTIIGAEAINWAFGLKIGPAAFVAAMKGRDRKKPIKRAARGKPN
jgi:hypothetical protein